MATRVKKGAKKAKKTATKAAAEGKPKFVKRIPGKTTSAVPLDQMSKEALGIIKKLDAFELAIADGKDGMLEYLPKLIEALGGSATFEHPERGPMSIMHRGENVYFWRSKPNGAAAKS